MSAAEGIEPNALRLKAQRLAAELLVSANIKSILMTDDGTSMRRTHNLSLQSKRTAKRASPAPR